MLTAAAAATALPPACLQERFARKNETQQLRAAFEALDANHDDLICADELRAYFESAGHKAKKVRCAHGRASPTAERHHHGR